MKNYELVTQWAASVKAEPAQRELEMLFLKHPWLKCPQAFSFISKMTEDMPKILNIIRMQEKQNAILRHENEKLTDYIKVNRMADEFILDEIRDKYKIDL